MSDEITQNQRKSYHIKNLYLDPNNYRFVDNDNYTFVLDDSSSKYFSYMVKIK